MPSKMLDALGQPPGDLDRHVAGWTGDINKVESNTPYAGPIEFREFVVGNRFVHDSDTTARNRTILDGGECNTVVCSVNAGLNDDGAVYTERAEHRKIAG